MMLLDWNCATVQVSVVVGKHATKYKCVYAQKNHKRSLGWATVSEQRIKLTMWGESRPMEMIVLLTVLSSFSMMICTCHWVGPCKSYNIIKKTIFPHRCREGKKLMARIKEKKHTIISNDKFALQRCCCTTVNVMFYSISHDYEHIWQNRHYL